MRAIRDVRTRLLLIVLVAVFVALVAATIGFNVLLARTSDQDANSLLRQRADTERGLIQVVGGHIQLAESQDDPIGDSRIWMFEGERVLEAPHARARTAAAAQFLAQGPRRFFNVNRSDERLYAVPSHRTAAVTARWSSAPTSHRTSRPAERR